MKNIKTIGFTSEVNKFLDISNIVISTSRQEGLPLNLLEAIYKKKFIIATDCRGNRDLIYNGKNGFTIKKVDEIYEKIKYAKENYANIQKNYQQAINIEEYTSKHVVEKMSELYEQILNKYLERKIV